MTEAVSLPVRSFVVGSVSSSKSAAEQSWNEACTDWATKTVALAAGGKSLGFNCGAPQNLNTSGNFLFASEATVTLRVDVPEGQEPAVSVVGPVSGTVDTSMQPALHSWRAVCEARASHLRDVYGDRFVAATCAAPKNANTSGNYRYESELTLTAIPLGGTVVELPGWIAGPIDSSLQPAIDGWRSACDGWLDAQAARSGGYLVGHSCGTPTNINTSGNFHFASPSVLRVQIGVPDGQELDLSAPTHVTGTVSASLSPALAAWQASCDEELDFLRQLYGARYLAASCHEPQNVNTSGNYRFRSDVELALVPAAGVVIEVPGFAFGEPNSSTQPAEESWRAGCRAWLADMTAVAGAEHLDGHACGTLVNGSSSGSFAYESATSLRVRAELPEGATPFSIDAGVAKGAPNSSRYPALLAWREACRQAIADQKTVVGELMLAASCAAPSNVSTSGNFEYASSVTVWAR